MTTAPIAPALPPSTKPVLVPVDFSLGAKAALVMGAQFAAWVGAPLVLLHVIHDPATRPGLYGQANGSGGAFHINDAAKRMLEEFVDGFVSEFPGLAAVPAAPRRLVQGLPKRRIVEIAHSMDACLVVMASEACSGVTRLLNGSTASYVSRHCQIPVTVLQSPPERRAGALTGFLKAIGKAGQTSRPVAHGAPMDLLGA
jgi:nucleotide-binding universal stress UspA family protein